MEDMWLEIYFGSSQIVMTYWTVYVAVLAAIIGFVVQRGGSFHAFGGTFQALLQGLACPAGA